jgi:hypothetical protein
VELPGERRGVSAGDDRLGIATGQGRVTELESLPQPLLRRLASPGDPLYH